MRAYSYMVSVCVSVCVCVREREREKEWEREGIKEREREKQRNMEKSTDIFWCNHGEIVCWPDNNAINKSENDFVKTMKIF